MPEQNSLAVSVIGTGRMGAALATALFKAGCPTTVWNRTAAKTEPLARLGLRVAQSLEAAMTADVAIVNVSDYRTTLELLKNSQVASALVGKTMVQLTTGTPQEARQMESWATQNQTHYLDGAIAGYPSQIGTPESAIFYSGPEAVFERVKPVLLSLANPVFVGTEVGHASAFDIAHLCVATGALFGFLQGYIVCEGEGLPVEVFTGAIKGLLPTLEGILNQISARLQKKEYAGAEATIEAWSAAPRELLEWSKDKGMDGGIARAQHNLIEKAISSGHGQADFSYLYEILRKKRRSCTMQ